MVNKPLFPVFFRKLESLLFLQSNFSANNFDTGISIWNSRESLQAIGRHLATTVVPEKKMDETYKKSFKRSENFKQIIMLQCSLEHRDGLVVFLSKLHLHFSWEGKGKHFCSPRCRRFPPPRKSPALRDDWCTITPQTHPLVPTTARRSPSSTS